jgi:hypothetical protein
VASVDEWEMTIEPHAEREAAIEENSFPLPDDVQVFVRKNNLELRSLIRSVLMSKTADIIPQAYWNWFRESRLPAVLFVRYWFMGALAAFVLLVVAIANTLMSGTAQFPKWGQLGIMGIQGAVFLIPMFSGRRVRLHFARHLAEHSGLLCPDCGYVLRGLPRKHNCPECGRAYTYASVHRYWYRWMSNHMHLNLARDNATKSSN